MKITSKYNEETAAKFATLDSSKANLSKLIYRDLSSLIRKHKTEGNALDFGCGPGLSTRFLKSLGFNVIGVDINQNMLINALSKQDGIPFAWIEHANISAENETFDVIQSIMVLLEMPSLEIMQEAVNELCRVLKKGGIFVCVVGSENFHRYNWINKTNPELEKSSQIKSGDKFKTFSRYLNMTFEDHYYTDEDYKNVFERAGFDVIEIHKAFGKDEDGIDWIIEKDINPFSHYICKKI